MNKDIIFGRDNTERITNCEIDNNNLILFIRNSDGTETKKFLNHIYYLLTPNSIHDNSQELNGNLYYKYITPFSSKDKLYKASKIFTDSYCIFDQKEAAMILKGFTLFKGMKIEDIPILSFDIETTTLDHNENSKLLIISNTFSYKNKRIRKLFTYDEFENEKEMLKSWCQWVKEINPDLLVLHNGYMFDLPYLDFIAKRCNIDLNLGKDDSRMKINNYTSKFRRDGSQFYEYNKTNIFGRQIIDTFFLSIKYDFSRKYENYKLKYIINYEGLEVKNRQFYDADKIRYNYKNKEEWEKIKEYAKYDADDSLNLFYLMSPPYFYLTQSIPMTFESMINRATGSQINSIMTRSYLQNKHSIPKASQKEDFEGAITFGNPGVYHNCFKIDFSSLYPSLIRHFNIYDKDKDPEKNLLSMIEYFAVERLKNKKLANETKDKYYSNLSESGKVFCNSAYGFMGAPGLIFNSPKNAALVTQKGREFLNISIDWAKQRGFQIINVDTDSIMISENGNQMTKEYRQGLLEEVNKLFPPLVQFSDDGYYKNVLVLKTKNYVLDDGKEIKMKGGSLKATTKEKALKEFIDEITLNLLKKQKDKVIFTYIKYIQEIFNIKDITRWTAKKTITDKILNPERLNEQKVLNAIENSEYKMADKIYVYYDKFDNLKLQENWVKDHNEERLLQKLYDTLSIFETIINIDHFPNLTLKRNKELLKQLLTT